MGGIEVFPPEIIREILLKVATVKSLLRLPSSFLVLINKETISKAVDVLFHKFVFSNALVLENPLQLPRPYKFWIIGSCNGLVCLVEDGKHDAVFIYNPATRRSNCLPIESVSSSGFYCYGFGYDKVSNDYKVVITETGSNMATTTRILSLNSGEWKEGGQFPCGYPNDDGKLLNGAIHWAAGRNNSSGSWKIVSLDLAKETYGEVLQPKYPEGHEYSELGVAGEWLCVLGGYVEKCVVDIWVMKVYGVKDSWTKLASIPYPHTWYDQILAPFYISEHGKLMLKFGRQLAIYDSKDSSSSVTDNLIECLEACTVVESLVSPFGLAGNNDR
ncbi:F-box associated interaction domain-containing protein [Artemisia annua]|uniref:F-box associated interaction domain-containing protein n=1 Tax=Artemisia annua TaxID=35608 RepID=A0A2U1PF13_ARTAN|nr:F-box associated interaction domain-containing protein [Artemisia annua]